MYRRIELINHPAQWGSNTPDYKMGLCGICQSDAVADAWTSLNSPRKRINKNVRFFFTEAGWDKFGRATVAACQKDGQDYRIIAYEEHDRNINVVYKDKYQVCIRPRKRRGKEG